MRVPKFLKYCKCECGEVITWKDYYRYYGIPDYILGHNTDGRKLREKGGGRSKLNRNIVNCSYCGKELERRKESPTSRYFCSEKCLGNYKFGKIGWNTIKKLTDGRKGRDYNYRPYFCDCGCGEICGFGKRFLAGHNSRTSEYKDKVVPKIFVSNDMKPNQTEIYMDALVQKARPDDFIFSGDGKIFIAGRVPDWFNINGKKQVIEYFSNYWHGEKLTGRTKEQEEKQRVNHFTKYGYKTLIIWESELKNLDKVIEKIRNF